MSGLTPGVTRRKTLSRLSSPKITDELLCWPEKNDERASTSSSWLPTWTKRTSSAPVPRVRPSASDRTHSGAEARSCNAS